MFSGPGCRTFLETTHPVYTRTVRILEGRGVGLSSQFFFFLFEHSTRLFLFRRSPSPCFCVDFSWLSRPTIFVMVTRGGEVKGKAMGYCACHIPQHDITRQKRCIFFSLFIRGYFTPPKEVTSLHVRMAWTLVRVLLDENDACEKL